MYFLSHQEAEGTAQRFCKFNTRYSELPNDIVRSAAKTEWLRKRLMFQRSLTCIALYGRFSTFTGLISFITLDWRADETEAKGLTNLANS
jgi:hypothetical protein